MVGCCVCVAILVCADGLLRACGTVTTKAKCAQETQGSLSPEFRLWKMALEDTASWEGGER